MQKRVCNMYVFQLSFHFACHRWRLGRYDGRVAGRMSCHLSDRKGERITLVNPTSPCLAFCLLGRGETPEWPKQLRLPLKRRRRGWRRSFLGKCNPDIFHPHLHQKPSFLTNCFVCRSLHQIVLWPVPSQLRGKRTDLE